MRAVRFKTEDEFLIVDTTADDHCNELLARLRLSILIKYGKAIENCLPEYNLAMPIGSEKITAEQFRDAFFNEILVAVDAYSASCYQYTLKPIDSYLDENQFFLDNVEPENGYEFMNLLFKKVCFNYIDDNEYEERKRYSYLNKFVEIRNYVKLNNVDITKSSYRLYSTNSFGSKISGWTSAVSGLQPATLSWSNTGISNNHVLKSKPANNPSAPFNTQPSISRALKAMNSKIGNSKTFPKKP